MKNKENSGFSVENPKNQPALSVAICGIRGIPACYGGFETFAEELAPRLSEKGHDVLVYGRKHVISHDAPLYKGVRIKLLPAPKHKYLETPLHTLLCFFDLVRNPVDALLVCNAANSPFLWVPKLRSIPVAVNLDGIERLRAKWNALGRMWYRLGEQTSVWFANEMVADAEVIREYYQDVYRRDSLVIRYGYQAGIAEVISEKQQNSGPLRSLESKSLFQELSLVPGKYLLYVSRLEPENNAHVVIKAYNELPEDLKKMPLVVVGDAPYASEYIEGLKRDAGPNVIFLGYRFGEDYKLLQQGAYLYIQATEVGGTHPALVEALGFANCVIANATPENKEVVADAGVLYEKNDAQALRQRIEHFICHSEELLTFRRRAMMHAETNFNWDEIASHYEELFRALAERRSVHLGK